MTLNTFYRALAALTRLKALVTDDDLVANLHYLHITAPPSKRPLFLVKGERGFNPSSKRSVLRIRNIFSWGLLLASPMTVYMKGKFFLSRTLTIE